MAETAKYFFSGVEMGTGGYEDGYGYGVHSDVGSSHVARKGVRFSNYMST